MEIVMENKHATYAPKFSISTKREFGSMEVGVVGVEIHLIQLCHQYPTTMLENKASIRQKGSIFSCSDETRILNERTIQNHCLIEKTRRYKTCNCSHWESLRGRGRNKYDE